MDYLNRLNNLQKKLTQNNVFAYLELSEINRFYLTGFKANPYPILFVDNKIYFFTSKMLNSQAQKIFVENFNNKLDIIPIIISSVAIPNKFVFKTMLDAFKYLKEKHKILDLSLNLANLKIDFYQKLDTIFNLKNVDIVENMRMIKDENEILNIRTACGFVKQIASYLPDFVHEDLTELELAKKIDLGIIRKSGEKAFDTIIAFGKNSQYPHHITGNTRFENDYFFADFGAKYLDYCSDITRTFVKNNEKMLEIYKAVEEIQKKIIEFVKPGLTTKEIDEKTNILFKQKRLDEYFLHSTGHGVGLEIHEKPAVARYDNTIIKKNMVITIEPGLYIEGVGGVRIEDTILITEKTCEILT